MRIQNANLPIAKVETSSANGFYCMHYRPGNLLHALRGTPEKGENTCKAVA